jgi:hypothetical protein
MTKENISKMLVSIACATSMAFLFQTAFSQEVRLDYSAPIDFGQFRTYSWQRAEKAVYPDDATDSILREAVDRQMTLRGFSRTENDSSDLYLVYHLAIMEDAEWGSFNTGDQWYSGGVNSVAIFTSATTNTTTFIKRGWLILEMFEVNGKKQIWQVSAKKTLGDDPKRIPKNADKVMVKIFKQFPVQQRK